MKTGSHTQVPVPMAGVPMAGVFLSLSFQKGSNNLVFSEILPIFAP